MADPACLRAKQISGERMIVAANLRYEPACTRTWMQIVAASSIQALICSSN
jgi:hypothetical protein